jgi:HK97 family phage major capsid protein
MSVIEQTRALREERMKAYNQFNAVVDATLGRERNAEENATIDRVNADINRLDAEIRDMDLRIQRDNENTAQRAIDEHVLGSNVDRRNVDANDQIRTWLATAPHMRADLEVDIRGAAREAHLRRSGASADEIRAMNYQTSSGSLVVPTTMAREFYQYLEASIAGLRIGATQLNTATGEALLLPKLGAHGIAVGSIPQGTAIAGTDATFAQVRMDSYKYGQLVAISNELLRDSAFDIGSWLAQDIGYGIGRLVDTDLMIGVGTANPKGMTVLAGAGTNAPIKTGGSLITPTYESLVDTVYSVNDAYRQMGAAWLMKDASAGILRKLRDGAGGTVGAVLWQPSLTNGIQGGQPDRLVDYPVFTDPNCATSGSNAIYATFGWFGEYVIRTVGNVQIESSEHLYFDKDQVAFRGKWTVDGDHRDVSALNSLVQNV